MRYLVQAFGRFADYALDVISSANDAKILTEILFAQFPPDDPDEG
jgi:hypothetical protein